MQNKEKQQIQAQSKAFPLIKMNTSTTSPNIKLNYQICERILDNTPFHKELLERIHLSKKFTQYSDLPYKSSVLVKQEDSNQNYQKVLPLEFYGLLRSSMDTRVEYSTSEDLKRLRESYIFHLMDYLFQERERVFLNDKKLFIESQEGKITLENIFELAGVKDNDVQEEPSQNLNEVREVLDISDSDFVKVADTQAVCQNLGNSIKDQGFTRPKILILAPFKQVAYQIVEMIIKIGNQGKWKKVNKKKKFREEFGSEEEAFNDYFRVGIGFNQSLKNGKRTLKLFESFYKSDIIVASPLGLRTITGQEGDENAQEQQRTDYDFLSSIEFLVMDQAEAFIYQNMEHLEEIMKMRLPNVKSLEHMDDARFSYFTKQIWDPLYDDNKGYTVLFVSSYFDFVRLRTFFKNRNAQVAMISEYSEKGDGQRSRHLYETGEKPILMVTERALVFQKINLRYAKNIVLYSLPESLDILTDCLGELFSSEKWKKILKLRISQAKTQKTKTNEEKLEETKMILQETHSEKSILALYSIFDKFQLERIVGSGQYKKMVQKDAKESFNFH